ncbi:aminotransferase class IV family protein [Chryseolinea sp. T2]|uniref:aminotransferase class IV family protein n=1 Tax=Chryseolinea sp. T2 TaxID=3129255 RepID=UPI003076994F
MSRFLESIAIVDGQIQRLRWHQERVNRTLQAHHEGTTIDLYAHIHAQATQQPGNVKCRVLYDREITEVQFAPYTPRTIKSLRMIENNDVDYPFKFADRKVINGLFDQKGSCDDILIVKNGRITDSSIANIVFRRNDKWLTPAEPLLKGTMRAYLIEKGLVTEADIAVKDLASFDGYKLINALLAFSSVEYPVSNINF